jgi:DNA-binding beta-propeller fold protein YncE
MTASRLFHRRTFLKTAAAAAAGLAAGAVPARATPAARIGEGSASFVLDEQWGRLPADMSWGWGCGIVVDARDRVYVTSRSTNPCVAIFSPDGTLLETWTKDLTGRLGCGPDQFAATAHGLYWSQEGDQEYLYWTENVHAPKGGSRLGGRVIKTDLEGNILFQLGNVTAESDTARKFDLTNPTDVAVAPNGDIYLVDGYGSQKLHRFDRDFKHLKTIGEPGKGRGQFSTCHGVWVSLFGKEPEVYVADRYNGRLQVFSPALEYKRSIPGMRTTSCFYQHAGRTYVADLAARVTVLDEKDQVVSQLGDGLDLQKAKADPAGHPEAFFAPHAVTLDSKGNLYVIEWLPSGRPRRFKPVV